MRKVLCFFVLNLLCALFFVAGCADKNKIDEIEKSQQEILSKLTAITANQEKILKFFQPRQPVDANKVQDIPIGTSPVKGDKNAPVTIVEFSDFQCPYCSKIQPTLKEVLKAYPKEVKLVFKQFPLSFHAQAKNAVKASLAASEQGKFWEMHDLIFENYNTLTLEMFIEFAKRLGLDAGKFASDFSSNKYDNKIQEDMDLAARIGVRGTPTLFINGRMMTGGRDVNDFKGMIGQALKEKG